MNDGLKQPCNDCPFRRNATPGWLGAAEPQWFVDAALSDYAEYQCGVKFAPCHQTVNYEDRNWQAKLTEAHMCIGALQFAANNGKLPRDPERSKAVNEAGTNPNVFAHPSEFIEYHEGAPVKSWLF